MQKANAMKTRQPGGHRGFHLSLDGLVLQVTLCCREYRKSFHEQHLWKQCHLGVVETRGLRLTWPPRFR